MSIFVFINPTGGKPLCYIERRLFASRHAKSFLFQSKSRFPTWYCFFCLSSRIFENVIAKWTFCVQQFFFRPISKVAIIKTESATIAFFFFSSLFLFLHSFSFIRVIFELLGFKKPAFWRLFAQMNANFVTLVFKKSVRDTSCQTHPSYCLT